MKYILGQPLSFILETTYPRSTTSATPVTIFFNWANKITKNGITQCLLSNEFTLKDSTHISVNLTTTSHMTGLLLEQVKNGDYIYITVVDIDASYNYIHKEIYYNYIQAFTSPEEAGETDNTNDNSSDVDKEEPINPYIGNNYSRNFHTSTHVYDLIDVLKASNSDIVAGQTNGAVLTYDSTKKGWYGKLLSLSDFSGGTSSGGSTTNNIVLYGPNSLNGTGDVDTSYDAIHSFNAYTINELYKKILDNVKNIKTLSDKVNAGSGGSTGGTGTGDNTPTNPAYKEVSTLWCLTDNPNITPTAQSTWTNWDTVYKTIDKGTFTWCCDSVVFTDASRKNSLNIRLVGTAEIYKKITYKYIQVDSIDTIPEVTTTGWSDSQPSYVANKYIWEMQVDTYPCGKLYYSNIRNLSNVTSSADHPDYDLRYFKAETSPTIVPASIPDDLDTPEELSRMTELGWVDNPTDSTSIWWVVYGKLKYHLDSKLYTVVWSKPIRVTAIDGTAKDGKFTEFRFGKSLSSSAYPNMDKWDTLKTTLIPDGYYTTNDANFPVRTKSDEYIWMTSAEKEAVSGGYQLVSNWAIPILVSGEKGIQGLPGPVGNTGPDGLHGTNIIEAYKWGTTADLSTWTIPSINRDIPPAGWSLSVPAKEDGKDVLYVIKNTQSYLRSIKTVDIAGVSTVIYDEIPTLSEPWKGPFPITASAARGEAQKGQVIYPAGMYSTEETYTTTAQTAPYVIDNDGNYYLLNNVMSWTGKNMVADKQHPKDATLDKGGPWVKFEGFDALYTKVGIIANGLVGSAVFNGDWMFSQEGLKVNNGILDTTMLVSYADPNIAFNPDNPTNLKDYKTYPISFVPSIALNMKDGSGHLAAGAIRWDNAGNIYLNSVTTNSLRIRGILQGIYDELVIDDLGGDSFTLNPQRNVFILTNSVPLSNADSPSVNLSVTNLGQEFEFTLINKTDISIPVFFTSNGSRLNIANSTNMTFNSISISKNKTLEFIIHKGELTCKQDLLIPGYDRTSTYTGVKSFALPQVSTPILIGRVTDNYDSTFSGSSLCPGPFYTSYNNSIIYNTLIKRVKVNNNNTSSPDYYDYYNDIYFSIADVSLLDNILKLRAFLSVSITPVIVTPVYQFPTSVHSSFDITIQALNYFGEIRKDPDTTDTFILRVRAMAPDGTFVTPIWDSSINPKFNYMFQIHVI